MPRPVRITGIKGRRHTASLLTTKGLAPSSFLATKLPKFTVDVKGVPIAVAALNKMSKDCQFSIRGAMKSAVAIVAHEARRIAKVGPYKAYDTGALVAHTKGMLEEFTLDYIIGTIGTFGLKYPVFVHEGTSKVPPRPYLLLALKRKKKIVVQLLRNALKKDIARGWF